MLNISETEFYNITDKVYNKLPTEFKELLENVDILVEDLPSEELVSSLGYESQYNIFASHTGTPITDNSIFNGFRYPNVIRLYRLPILQTTKAEDLEDRIYNIILHEIAHFFGFSETEVQNAMKGCI